MLSSPQARFLSPPHVSGKGGVLSLNLHRFVGDDVVLPGHLRGAHDGKIHLARDLPDNLARPNRFEANMIRHIDAYVARADLDAPEEDGRRSNEDEWTHLQA